MLDDFHRILTLLIQLYLKSLGNSVTFYSLYYNNGAQKTSIYIKYILNGYNTLTAFWISLKDLKSSLEKLIYKAPVFISFLI